MDGLGSGPAYWGRGLLDKAGTAGKLTGEHAPGIAGWRWIFIIFGVVTFSVVIVCFPLIVNFPEKQTTDQRLAFKFLNQEQLDWVVNRIQREREDVYAEDFSIKFYIKQLADVDLWAYVVMFMAATATSYAVIYFLPIILRQGELLRSSSSWSSCLFHRRLGLRRCNGPTIDGATLHLRRDRHVGAWLGLRQNADSLAVAAREYDCKHRWYVIHSKSEERTFADHISQVFYSLAGHPRSVAACSASSLSQQVARQTFQPFWRGKPTTFVDSGSVQ